MARVCGTDFDVVVWKGGWDIVNKNEFHPKEKEKLPKFKFGKLRRLFFEVVDACNFKCIHCYNAPQRTTRIVDEKRFYYSLKKLNTLYSFDIIQITGGEPSLHPQLRRLVETALLFSEKVEIFTNGSMLNILYKELNSFKDKLVVRVSFYTLKEALYNLITRSSVNPNNVAENIIKLRENGFDVRVEVPLIPGYNEKEVDIIYLYFRDHNIPVRSSYIIPYGNATSFPPQKIPFERRLPSQSNWIFYPPSEGGYNECWATHLAIDTSLNVYPCIFAREWYLGNLEKDAVETIFQNHKRVSQLYSPDNLHLCKKCAFRYICKRCPPRAKAHGVLGTAEAGCPLLKKVN